MRAWVVMAAIVASTSGCGEKYCGESPSCPLWFDVHGWCGSSKKCTLDGGFANCYSGGCEIPRGKTLRIPLPDVDLGMRHELLVQTFAALPGADPASLTIRLNGAAAVVLPSPRGTFETVFGWAPFPAPPWVLELSHDDAHLSQASFELFFHDYPCRNDHPPKECPK
jgi:hypothetical protein